jgi:phosphoribosyl 1,2-cyclic phosphate phosphodiesterase
LRFTEHPTHLNVERSLEYIAELKPRRTYLTHMNHEVLHARDSKRLPEGVWFGYDGLVLTDE